MGFFMSRNPSYVVRQSCGYCYRQVVPPDLRDLVGRTELRYNLYTGSLRDAKSRARVISGQVHSLFIKIKRKGYIMSDSQLTEAKINAMIKGYVKETIKEMEIDIPYPEKDQSPVRTQYGPMVHRLQEEEWH